MVEGYAKMFTLQPSLVQPFAFYNPNKLAGLYVSQAPAADPSRLETGHSPEAAVNPNAKRRRKNPAALRARGAA